MCIRDRVRGEQDEKVSGFLKKIRRWRRMAVYTPIHKLIQSILTETGYLEYIQSKPGGDQRRANVEMLLVRAAAFEKTSYYGLFHFLRYMKQLEKYQVDYGEADVLDENADVVRIMSCLLYTSCRCLKFADTIPDDFDFLNSMTIHTFCLVHDNLFYKLSDNLCIKLLNAHRCFIHHHNQLLS